MKTPPEADVARLEQALADMQHELELAVGTRKSIQTRWRRAREELNRLKPVIEQAIRWSNAYGGGGGDGYENMDLHQAVRAYLESKGR